MIDPDSLPTSVEARDYLGRVRTYRRPEWPHGWSFIYCLKLGFFGPVILLFALMVINENIRVTEIRTAVEWIRRATTFTGPVDGILQAIVLWLFCAGTLYGVIWLRWRMALLGYIKRVVEARQRRA